MWVPKLTNKPYTNIYYENIWKSTRDRNGKPKYKYNLMKIITI